MGWRRTKRSSAGVCVLLVLAGAVVVASEAAGATTPPPVTFADSPIFGDVNGVLADVNLDAKLDAVGTNSVRLGTGKGKFNVAASLPAAVTRQHVFDANHDPYPDIVGTTT